MDPKLEEKFKEASEDSSILQDQTKTKIQITINGEDVFLMKIQKHSTNFTLADVKNQILHKPKINCQWKSWFGRNRWGWYYFEIAWKQHWNGMLVQIVIFLIKILV